MDSTRPELLSRVKRYLARAVAERSAAGCPDLDAWEEFFDLYNGILARFAVKLGLRGHEIDELLQEVWLDVVRLLRTFNYEPGRGGFRRWLYRIVRSKAADVGRKRQRLTEPILLDPHGSAWQGLPGPAADPVEEVHKRFLTEVVQHAVERFHAVASSEEWQVFERCKLQGQASPQVAEELGLSPEAVRKRLQRSLVRFRETMSEFIGAVPVDDVP